MSTETDSAIAAYAAAQPYKHAWKKSRGGRFRCEDCREVASQPQRTKCPKKMEARIAELESALHSKAAVRKATLQGLTIQMNDVGDDDMRPDDWLAGFQAAIDFVAALAEDEKEPSDD